MSPPFLLLQHHTHFSESKLGNERAHHFSHVIRPLRLLGEASHSLDGSNDVLPVQVAIPIIFQVLHHLLRCPLNPLGSLSPGALVAPQLAQVLGFGFDYPAGVVVGKWILAVLGLGFRLIAVAEGPGVWGD